MLHMIQLAGIFNKPITPKPPLVFSGGRADERLKNEPIAFQQAEKAARQLHGFIQDCPGLQGGVNYDLDETSPKGFTFSVYVKREDQKEAVLEQIRLANAGAAARLLVRLSQWPVVSSVWNRVKDALSIRIQYHPKPLTYKGYPVKLETGFNPLSLIH